MDELEKLRRRPRLAQLLDDAEAHPAAAVHRHAGRFVQRDQVLVFEHHRELARRCNRLGAAVGNAHRRHAHLVADGEPRIGGCATFVDAHFAGADHAIDMRLGHAFEPLDEEVVEPLALAAFIDRDAGHGERRCRTRHEDLRRRGLCAAARFGPYNPLHHVCDVSV